MKTIKMWVVTHSVYWNDAFFNKFPGKNMEVREFYRDYHFENALLRSTPDFILSRGKCKTRFAEHPEESVGIYYSAREAVRKAGKKIPVFPIFFPIVWIWIYRIFFKKTKQ